MRLPYMHPLRGTGCYVGLPHMRAAFTVLFVHDDYGNLVRTDRYAAYSSLLPFGWPPQIPVVTPVPV